MSRPRKVTPAELERLWGEASLAGKDAALELGDPVIDVLVVNGRDVAYAPKPKDGAALADQHIADAKAAAGIGGA